MADPEVKARVETQAGRAIGGSPAELDALVALEIAQFTKVVRELNIRPE